MEAKYVRLGPDYEALMRKCVVCVEGDVITFDSENPAWLEATVRWPKPQASMPTCPRCGSPMAGGCRKSCQGCGYSAGCGD